MLAKEELKKKYDQKAVSYDWAMGPLNALYLNALRRMLLKKAHGRVLEVAAGTGKNFQHYSKDVQLTATDLSVGMLEMAKQRAKRVGLAANLNVMDAERLEFPDDSFDTVVSTLSLCSFPKPLAALSEMKRVCKLNGKLLFLEHGKSSSKPVAAFQDKYAESYARTIGCHWNRKPDELLEQAGLTIIQMQRSFLGIFYTIEAVKK